MKPETALKKINEALFPKPRKQKDGTFVDSDAYYNLEGVLQDLKHRGDKRDLVCVRTIERVQGQIVKASKALQQAGFK